MSGLRGKGVKAVAYSLVDSCASGDSERRKGTLRVRGELGLFMSSLSGGTGHQGP